jgi:hypothetical protein
VRFRNTAELSFPSADLSKIMHIIGWFDQHRRESPPRV